MIDPARCDSLEMINGDSEYAEIPGFPGYAAGKDGSIWSTRLVGKWTRSKSKATKHTSGYIMVGVRCDGRAVNIGAHRLVLMAFNGLDPDKPHVRHLNGIRDDNRLENLAWGTPKENSDDKLLHGTYGIGSKHSQAKFTEDQVLEIRRLRASGVSPKELAEAYGVTRVNICELSRGRSWKHLPEKFVPTPRKSLDPKAVQEIRDCRRKGETLRAIGAKFGICNTTVKKLVDGKTYSHIPDSP